MELDCRVKHYFERNDDETDPWSGSQSRSRRERERESGPKEEEEEEEKRIEPLDVPPPAVRRQTVSSSYAAPARNRSKTFCHAALDKLVSASERCLRSAFVAAATRLSLFDLFNDFACQRGEARGSTSVFFARVSREIDSPEAHGAFSRRSFSRRGGKDGIHASLF